MLKGFNANKEGVKENLRANWDDRFFAEISPEKYQFFSFLKRNLPHLFTCKVERLYENKEFITRKRRYLQFSGPKNLPMHLIILQKGEDRGGLRRQIYHPKKIGRAHV